MERALVVYGVLFVVLPLLLAAGALALSGMVAFVLTIALVALLSFGFIWGIAFVDLSDG